MRKIRENIHWIIIGIVLLFMLCVFAFNGQKGAVLSGKGVLDMFIPQYKILRDEEKFFAQDVSLNVCGGVGRDLLYSEFKITSLPFMLLPVYPAYVLLFLLKIIVGMTGVAALGKAVLKDKYVYYSSILWLVGFAFAIFNVFPAYWMSFASLPWLFFFLYKLRMGDYKWLIALLLYPFFSDMLHFGLIIVPAILIYLIYVWIKTKKFPVAILVGDILLALGYAATEYRYIGLIYNEDVSIIYDVEEWDELSVEKILTTMKMVFWDYEYMPKMLSYLIIPTAILLILILVFIKSKRFKINWLAEVLAVVAIAAVLFTNSEYNDVIHTITANEDSISFDEYYNAEIYSDMKQDVGYLGQWTISYGMNAGALSYSGIKAIDGKIDMPLCEAEHYYTKMLNKSLGEFATDENGKVQASLDLKKLKQYGTRYICSGADIVNASEQGLTFVNKYSNEKGEVYLYITSSRYQDAEMAEVPYEERSKLTYDIEDYEKITDELDELVKEANEYRSSHPDMSDEEIVETLAGEKVREDYYKLLEFDELISAVYSICDIGFNSDPGNEELADRLDIIYKDALYCSDDMYANIREICKSPYNVIIAEEMSEYFVEAMIDYEDMTDEEKERAEKIKSLENEYTTASAEDYYYDYNGTEWTLDMLVENMDELTYEEYADIYYGIVEESSKVLGEIYLELIELNNEVAVDEGYDNYAEYAYDVEYGRDYTVDDAKKLFKQVKKYGYTYQKLINNKTAELNADVIDGIVLNDRKVYEQLYPYFNELDEGIGVTLNHMLRNDLFDLKPDDNKSQVGYTVAMPYYGDAYIFDAPTGNTVKDLGTHVHEFGHYVWDVHDLSNIFEKTHYMDVLEIYSQGMEALICQKYKEIYGEEAGEYLEKNEMEDIASAIWQACVVAEFEIYAYEHPDSTLEELGRVYSKIEAEYYGARFDRKEGDFSWVNIPHIYQSPMYYIAYATSAFSSIEIYNLSKEYPELAKEKYLEMSALGSGWKYRGINEFVGLDDIFKRGTVRKIYRDFYSNYN